MNSVFRGVEVCFPSRVRFDPDISSGGLLIIGSKIHPGKLPKNEFPGASTLQQMQDSAALVELQKIEQALRELSSTLKPPVTPPPPEKPKWLSGIWELLKVLIPSLIIFWVTYSIKDSVDMALHERQLQLDYVKEMGKLDSAMQDPKLTPEDATNNAIQLAAFGKYSIPFFLHVLEGGNQISIAGAIQGLHMMSMTEPDEVCRQLALVISNRSGLYKWTTHLAAMQLLGEAGCSSATHTVENYTDTLTLENLQVWVSPQPVPNSKEFAEVKEQAEKTLKVLQRLSASASR
jgi:hypothetical protein